ncbi:MAG: tetratricopeptide repeat protein [Candidatus Gastranaerophilales bacterium]|nr:tetratricopeptide repeat protein [Candidatus Gastranaerophilales bacterium]
MQNIKKAVIIILVIINIVAGSVFASVKTEELDILRANLACQKDKTSQEYIKAKEKFNKLIISSKIDYSPAARLQDAERMISEQKYNSAIYELNDLIENNTEISKSNELLGDICLKSGKNNSKSAHYYKEALKADETNISATFKLAKLYLREKRNILGTEYLKKTIELSKTTLYFPEIENIILNKVKPQNRFEANNLYETLGVLYLKSGKSTQSYSAFSKALELNPEDICLRYQFANLLYLDNQTDTALSMYNTILKENPKDSQIRNSKAKILFKGGNALSANKEYLTILSQYPDSNQAKYGIYKIYKDKLTPEKIMLKFHDDDPYYALSINEVEEFYNFLNEIKDYEAVKIFNPYLEQLKKQEEDKRKATEQKLLKKQQTQNNQLQKARLLEKEEAINKNIIAKQQKKQDEDALIKMQTEKKRIEQQELKKAQIEKKKQ